MEAATTTEENQRRKKVHIVLSGPSGQCGKSTFARIMLERAREKEKELTLVDTDRENPDVAIAYDPDAFKQWKNQIEVDPLKNYLYQPVGAAGDPDQLVEQIVFSEDPKYAHLTQRFTELVETSRSDLIVSTPAGMGIELWLDEFNVNSEATNEDREFDLVCWWVSGGSRLSQDKLIEFRQKYNSLQMACVLNKGAVLDVVNWDMFRAGKQLSTEIEKGTIKLAEIEAYKSKHILEAVAGGSTLSTVLDEGMPTISGRTPLTRMTKAGLRGWLEKAWASIEATNLVHG